jgi:hypothetical protein
MKFFLQKYKAEKGYSFLQAFISSETHNFSSIFLLKLNNTVKATTLSGAKTNNFKQNV